LRSPLFDGCVADCAAVAAPPCFASKCNPATGQCEIRPDDGAACDDSLFCTVNDHCAAGACVGDVNGCGLTAPTCKAIACDEPTRSCRFIAQDDGTTCTGGDTCGLGGSCKGGQCVADERTCRYEPAPDDCHVAACNPKTGACDIFVPGNEGLTCDADPCMVSQTCHNGVCQGGNPRDCRAWTDDCHTAACDMAHQGCYGVAANAGNACSAGAACNTGVCDANGACALTPTVDGTACSDGIACTTGDVCTAGKCAATTGPSVYFSDTFADNALGWTTEGTWMIGHAKDEASYPYSQCKPAKDHTQFGDNGVATTAIGGHEGERVHDFTYLTSPAFDASSAPTLLLTFSYVIQWLNPPYQDAVVEVWNGSTWVGVWEWNQPQPDCLDLHTFKWIWQAAKIDITAHKNAAMKIRFGLASKLVAASAGWTLDDVALVSAACP
jgi:hypothetical protein